MEAVFYISAAVALVSTSMVITRSNAVHALLYLIVSLLAVATVFFVLGAHFVAALEVIIYAGAIMVLFVFVVMMLNVTSESSVPASLRARPRAWAGPAILGLILVLELAYVSATAHGQAGPAPGTEPRAVGIALFQPYLLGVEMASLLLMAGLIGAYHLGRREKDASPQNGGPRP